MNSSQPLAMGASHKCRRRSLAGAVVLSAAVLAFAAHYFWRQVRIYTELQRVPFAYLSLTPRAVVDKTVSTSPGTRLCFFGYSFEVPWTGIEKEWGDGRYINIEFAKGQRVFFGNPDYWQTDVLKHGLPNRFFGEDIEVPPTGTKYDDLRVTLLMTPSRLWPLASHWAFQRRLVYLLAKGTWLGHPISAKGFALFAVAGNHYRGFETIGRPNGGVGITLFDESDRMFSLGISTQAGGNSSISQSESNRVITSFGPEPSCSLHGTGSGVREFPVRGPKDSE